MNCPNLLGRTNMRLSCRGNKIHESIAWRNSFHELGTLFTAAEVGAENFVERGIHLAFGAALTRGFKRSCIQAGRAGIPSARSCRTWSAFGIRRRSARTWALSVGRSVVSRSQCSA